MVDAGNLFFKKPNAGQGTTGEIAKITAESILKSFNQMGCDAINLGANDFAAGLDYLLDLRSSAQFAFVSANVKDENGNAIFDPYTVVDRDGISLGIIGLSDLFNNPEISFDDPKESLYRYINEVDQQSDLVVVLIHADDALVTQLANLDLPVDLIIQSKSRKRSNDGGIANTPVFNCGDRGKYLYLFEANIADPNLEVVDASKLRSIVKQNRNKIAVTRQKMRQSGSDPVALEQEISQLEEQNKEYQTQLGESINTLDFRRIEMGKDVPHRPDVLTIIEAGKAEVDVIAPKTVHPGNTRRPTTQARSSTPVKKTGS